MTVRQLYEAILIETNKVNAPNLLLEDFNYISNKAIYLYINKRYNIYDVNQQTTDDIRVLKTTAELSVTESVEHGGTAGAVYEVELPSDYLHLLNCICNFKVKKPHKCYTANTHVLFAAIKMTSDTWPLIVNNFYMRPAYNRPYYYIHNINSSSSNPTNPYSESETTLKYIDQDGKELIAYKKVIEKDEEGKEVEKYVPITISKSYGTDASIIDGKVSGLPKTITIGGTNLSLVDKLGLIRYGNTSTVRMEIRCGSIKPSFELESVFVDYLKTPLYIRLTQEQLDLTEDTSLMIEFPDYVCYEIINELVLLVMENSSDPRLQTHIPVTQSIANPAQQLTKS